MRHDERESLRRRFRFRCGYCGVREDDVGAELTVDHFQPRSHGGLDEPENWVYCCHPCNEFKGDYWLPESSQCLLHPLQDDVTAHLSEREDGTLQALSPRGARHVERLHLNRPQLVAYRRERQLMDTAREAQTHLLESLNELERQIESLTAQLERLVRGDESS